MTDGPGKPSQLCTVIRSRTGDPEETRLASLEVSGQFRATIWHAELTKFPAIVTPSHLFCFQTPDLSVVKAIMGDAIPAARKTKA